MCTHQHALHYDLQEEKLIHFYYHMHTCTHQALYYYTCITMGGGGGCQPAPAPRDIR